MKPRNRKLVVENNNTHEPNLTNSNNLPLHEPLNATVKKPINPNTPFDSSMALTVLALLVALFFMGLFSIYIRRFAAAGENSDHRRIHRQSSPLAVGPARRASAQKGVDQSTVRSLPVYCYHRGDEKCPPNDCAVCLTEFEEREEVKVIPYCRHVFHAYCIERWLSSHVSCPLCRTTSFFPAKEDDEDLEGRLTVEIGDTWTSGVRRTNSCSSLGERSSLQRSSSF